MYGVTWAVLSLFRRAAEGIRHPGDEGHVIDAAGWLHGPRVVRVPAHESWYGRPLDTGTPTCIVQHYSATDPGTAAAMARRRARKRDPKVDRAASWHASAETDGAILQMIPFTSSAWHCAKGQVSGVRVNACSVGIELIGHGKVFTQAQIEAYEHLLRALVEVYSITRKNAALNHSDFDPTRRKDAGPVWNGEHLPGILERAFGTP